MPIDVSTQAWNEAAATIDATEVMLLTAELIHSAFVENGVQVPVRFMMNNEDLTLRVEPGAPFDAGQAVLFRGVPVGIGFPRISNLGVEAPIWIDNVNREIAKYLDAASKLNESVLVILRGYLASDPNTVGYGPFQLKLQSVKRTGARLDGKLTIADPRKLRVLREIFDATRFQALLVAAGA